MKIKAGLLPLYMDMIDKTSPQARSEFQTFINRIIDQLKALDLHIVPSEISCKKEEVIKAINLFTRQDVDAIITLHLTYSPSLESAPVLARTKIPIIVLDTTQSYEFGPGREPGDVLYNHAIHGVQDFCNVLRRYKKKFFIEAGHWERSDVLKRIKKRAIQAKMVKSFTNIKVGLLDEPLEGMGDFQVQHEVLSDSFGFNIIRSDSGKIKDSIKSIPPGLIKEEIDMDRERFDFDDIDEVLYKNSIKVSLGLRNWIRKNDLDSFSMNVFKFAEGDMPHIPFLETSKELAEGIGYAGEGDILTSSLTHSIMRAYPETTFTEMFCPDWKNNSIFISHIGEGNYNLISGIPKLISKKYALVDFKDVVVAVGGLKSGKACIVDIAPGPDNTFGLILIEGEMLGIKGKDNLNMTIHGWFRPDNDINEVLAEYSKVGGTHHKVLVYGDAVDNISGFGEMMGWKVTIL